MEAEGVKWSVESLSLSSPARSFTFTSLGWDGKDSATPSPLTPRQALPTPRLFHNQVKNSREESRNWTFTERLLNSHPLLYTHPPPAENVICHLCGECGGRWVSQYQARWGALLPIMPQSRAPMCHVNFPFVLFSLSNPWRHRKKTFRGENPPERKMIYGALLRALLWCFCSALLLPPSFKTIVLPHLLQNTPSRALGHSVSSDTSITQHQVFCRSCTTVNSNFIQIL